jgi:uncharacterized protein
MRFSGNVVIAAPRDRVWEFVNDPERVVPCGPGVERVEVRDADHFTATARVGIGAISLRFSGDGEFTERVPPESATVRGRANAPGSVVDLTANMALRDGEEDGTSVMDWTAEVRFSGTIASLGARLIEGTARRLIGQAFDCIKARIEPPTA